MVVFSLFVVRCGFWFRFCFILVFIYFFGFFFSDNVSVCCLYIVEDDGEVDIDFFSLDFNEFIYKFGFSILVLVEKYLFLGLIFKELFFVRM